MTRFFTILLLTISCILFAYTYNAVRNIQSPTCMSYSLTDGAGHLDRNTAPVYLPINGGLYPVGGQYDTVKFCDKYSRTDTLDTLAPVSIGSPSHA